MTGWGTLRLRDGDNRSEDPFGGRRGETNRRNPILGRVAGSGYLLNATGFDVELGAAEGDFIEVIGDIKAGDKVVIRGGERLRDGQAVTLTEIASEPSV